MNKIPLRVTDGLDAAGQKVVNVGYPSTSSPLDGVNIKYFVDENTIQPYSATRTYKKDFAVTFNGRVYISTVDINTPEQFNSSKWNPTRVDPSWKLVTSNIPIQTTLYAGDHAIVQTSGQDITFTLPTSPLSGDMIVIRDNDSNLHDYTVDVNGNGKNINGFTTYRITATKSTHYFIYSGMEWIGQAVYQGDTNKKFISNSSYPVGFNFYKSKVGEYLMRETKFSGGISIRLPKYAKNGDCIMTYDLDGMNPVTKTTMFVHPDSGHTITVDINSSPVTTASFDSTDWGFLSFDSRTNTWRVFDSDTLSRWQSIKVTNFEGSPNDRLVVYTDVAKTVNITFPKDAAHGDSFFVDTRYMMKDSLLVLKINDASTNDYFIPDGNILTNPRISAYRAMLNDLDTYITKSQTFTITNRCEQWEFVYFKNALNTGNDVWALATMVEMPFRVDRNDTSFYGLAAIATQTEVNKNKENITSGQNRESEAFVTPETLANKLATGANRGIARLASDAESKATSGSTEGWNSVIMTPERVNNRLATTSMRGVLRLATQAQTNAMTGTGENWTSLAITPQTLNGRIASETQSGMVTLVPLGGTKQATRTTAGTGIHDFNNNSEVVTAKSLFEKVATIDSQGMVFIGNQTEVNGGTADTTNGALVVTASTLHARQASTTLTGLSRAATSTETNSNTPPVGDNIHVTVSAFAARTANETRWGLAETATQAEVDAGTLHDRWMISPKTFGNWLARERLTVVTASGLTTSGTIWNGQQFDIVVPTELQRGSLRIATQVEANDMSGSAKDDVALTPKKLSQRQASTTQTGILFIATGTEVNTGTNDTKAVSPNTLLAAMQSANYKMTEARYGVGKMSVLANGTSALTVFEGNDVSGSTRTLTGYAHTDVVVSPRGLNTALSYYLPSKAVAVSSSAMETSGGLRVSADDWVRRTVDQTITGALSLTKDLTVTKGTARILIHDSGTGQNTYLKYANATDATGWETGIASLGGRYDIKRLGTTAVALWVDTTAAAFSGIVSNGGQDPSSSNHLTRYGYTESRYVRSSGSVNENITGEKTFKNSVFMNAGAGQEQRLVFGASSVAGIRMLTDENLYVSSKNKLTFRPNGMNSSVGEASISTEGNLSVSSQVKIGSAIPLAADDAIRKDYLDSVIDDVNASSGSRVHKLGDTMTGELIINATSALTANGEVKLNGTTTVNKFRIAVGNGEFLEIRPNPVTKSVDFVWIS